MSTQNNQNNLDKPAEEHKALSSDYFNQATKYFPNSGFRSGFPAETFKHCESAQYMNPESDQPTSKDYGNSYQKGSKNDQDGRSKEESPSELAKKQPFTYHKNQYKKQGQVKDEREFGNRFQNQYYQKYQVNELYELGPEVQNLVQSTNPFKGMPPYNQKYFQYKQAQPTYQNAYANQYQSESESEYLAQMQAGYLDKQRGYANNTGGSQKGQQQRAQRRFTEKHLIESLQVNASVPQKPVMFYNMLNQGNKRGKETQVLALDCERVLTDKGERLARVSIVNFYGNIVFDTLVKPCDTYYEEHKVLDYREWITGIKPIDLDHAPTFSNIEPIIKKIIKDKTIVGHSLQDDLKILKLDSEEQNCVIRDISSIKIFMRKVDRDSLSPIREKEDDEDSMLQNSISGSKQSSQDGTTSTPIKSKKQVIANFIVIKRKLKELSEEFLNAQIQDGHHSSVIDARAALALYRMHYEQIEMEYRCEQALKEINRRRAEKEQIIQDFREVVPEQRESKSQKSESDDKSFKSFGSDKENEANSLKLKANPQSQDVKKSDKESPSDTRNILQMMKSSDNVEGAMKNEEIKDIEYLIKNNAEIFNITPPNAKDEDKQKKGRYQLINKDPNQEWRGFKSSHIMPEKGKKYQSQYGRQANYKPHGGRYIQDGYAHQNRRIDPFSQNWTFATNENYVENAERGHESQFYYKKMRYQDEEEAKGWRKFSDDKYYPKKDHKDHAKSAAANPEI